MQNPPSPLDTLRQLKEMLDAGALTPSEFEALKQRLVFNEPLIALSLPPAAPPLPMFGASGRVNDRDWKIFVLPDGEGPIPARCPLRSATNIARE